MQVIYLFLLLEVSLCIHFKGFDFFSPVVMLMLPLHAGQRTRCVTGCRSRVLVFM